MRGDGVRRAAVAAGLAMTSLLAACGSTVSDASDAGIPGHVHNLAWDGDTLMLGTHHGLWAHESGSAPVQRSTDAFDVMGLARAGETWLASGHPPEGSDGPSNIGLLRSTDGGTTFTLVSAEGIDFHRLTASGSRILGVSSADEALLRSDDAGATWTSLGRSPVFDLALDPRDPNVVVGMSPDGVVRSTDGGTTFAPVPVDALLALLSWSDDGLMAVDIDGRVHRSDDGGLSWTAVGALPGQAAAFTAAGDRVAALVDGSILESRDGGVTFTERLAGLS